MGYFDHVVRSVARIVEFLDQKFQRTVAATLLELVPLRDPFSDAFFRQRIGRAGAGVTRGGGIGVEVGIDVLAVDRERGHVRSLVMIAFCLAFDRLGPVGARVIGRLFVQRLGLIDRWASLAAVVAAVASGGAHFGGVGSVLVGFVVVALVGSVIELGIPDRLLAGLLARRKGRCLGQLGLGLVRQLEIGVLPARRVPVRRLPRSEAVPIGSAAIVWLLGFVWLIAAPP